MKKSLLALAVLGAFAGAASAQTNVTVYGVVDLGLMKSTGDTTSMINGDNSRLGFKGTEDLGGGLSANFRLEQRFDANTGKNEGNGSRPTFQGRSWVGLSGNFGSIRFGRDLTPKQAGIGDFDPWGAPRARPGQAPDVMDANYVSDPLNPSNGAQNRWSNAVYYTTPVFSGFKVDLAVATKQGLDVGAPLTTPVSFAASYANGPIAAAVIYEKNAVKTDIWQIGGSYDFGAARVMATYAKTRADENVTLPSITVVGVDPVTGLPAVSTVSALGGEDASAWTIGATAKLGTGKLLAGYGEAKADEGDGKIKKFSIGYEHPLSKRTFVYVDASSRKVTGNETINGFDFGINHSF